MSEREAIRSTTLNFIAKENDPIDLSILKLALSPKVGPIHKRDGDHGLFPFRRRLSAFAYSFRLSPYLGPSLPRSVSLLLSCEHTVTPTE